MSGSISTYSLAKINPKLLRRIYRACRPSLNEPNLALNLEICDYVNAKQGSTPREAALAIVKLINQRDPQISELAISLLDNLVKNCGYPFQLQISRKEFLNELVKRFPEKPPLRYSRLHRLILAQIEEWYQTICRTSRYKSDFGYIKDMHRLLLNKGYIFPEVKVEDAAVLNPSDNLKSLEEIQKEDAIVHSAKLQELIRRGKPQDLQEANKLMKIMAGFKDDHLEEKKQQIIDDVARLKRKVEILAEMLNSLEDSNQTVNDSNEAVVDLYGSIKSSQPIIKKIIEESEDESRVSELLALNDNANHVIEKFNLLKIGKIEEASRINVQGSTSSSAADLNLIDFDDDAPISDDKSGKDDQGYNNLLADLSNLTFTSGGANNDLFGSGGSIAIGGSAEIPGLKHDQPSQPQFEELNLLSDIKSPSPQLQSNTNQLDPFSLSFPSSSPAAISQSNLYKQKQLLHSSSYIKIEYQLKGTSQKGLSEGKFLFSNVQSSSLYKIKFMMAVPKSCKLTLKPQSVDVLHSYATDAMTQAFEIENNQDKQLKIKWKIEYEVDGKSLEETGVSVLE